jgi:hypothetical protein
MIFLNPRGLSQEALDSYFQYLCQLRFDSMSSDERQEYRAHRSLVALELATRPI